MKGKKGISLAILVITIIVMIILASTVIYISADLTNDSKKVAFELDLTQIEESVTDYYLNNGELPIVLDSQYSKSEFVQLITDGADGLNSEISENGNDEATFYEIDLSKISVEGSTRGLKFDGDNTDAYFVSSIGFNVYYLKGEQIGGVYYFSLTEKLTGKEKVNNNQANIDNSNIIISNTTNGIKLVKNTSEYTNDLKVTVSTTLSSGEKMRYEIAGIEVSASGNEIDVADVLLDNANVKEAFYENDNNKYLIAQKIFNNEVVSETKIDISNLDILSGTDMSSITITYTKSDSFTLANISGYTDLGGSGVKEARVLYTAKVATDGTVTAYYDNLPETITSEYVKNTGKAFSANFLRLPNDVKSYVLVFVDNAGNISDMRTFTIE